MASLTKALKAKLHTKVDESIGPIGPYRYRLHDAIRGGVLVDAIYILLNLHRVTVKRETKAIVAESEAQDTIFILRNQLADAERELASARSELAEANAHIDKHEEASEQNLALFRERGAKLAEARQELAEARQELENQEIARMEYMAFHQEDTHHITSLAAQVKDLKAELAANKEQNRKLEASVRFYQEVRQEEVKGIQQLHKEKAELNAEIGGAAAPGTPSSSFCRPLSRQTVTKYGYQ